MKRISLSILVLFAAFTSCVTSPMVSEQVTYTNKGSKSEGRSWNLIVDGTKLPDCFSAILVNGKLYLFKTKKWLWGDDGYVLTDASINADLYFPTIEREISKDELAQGWADVKGRFDKKPAGWFFVKWYGGMAALSTDKIETFVREKSLKTIPRVQGDVYLKAQKQGD